MEEYLAAVSFREQRHLDKKNKCQLQLYMLIIIAYFVIASVQAVSYPASQRVAE